jgi:drug/metabolite transporter (DMT)-like permease
VRLRLHGAASCAPTIGAVKLKHFAQLLALSALWGTTFLFTRYASPVLGPNVLVALRLLLAAATLALLMRLLRQRWPIEHWRELVMLGLLSVAGPHVLYSWSSLHLPAGYAALLSVSSVLFGAIASAWMRLEAMTVGRAIGCLLGLCGAALLVRLGPMQVTHTLVVSALTCMAGSAMSGLSSPLLKQSMARMDPLGVTAGMHVVAALALLPAGIYDWPGARLEPGPLAAVALMGVGTSALAWWAYMRIMKHTTAVGALSSSYMITGFGVLYGVVFLGERTGAAMYAGGAILFLAVLLVSGTNPLRLFAGTAPRR